MRRRRLFTRPELAPIAATILVFALWAGCADAPPDSPTAPVELEFAAQEAEGPPGLERAIAAQEKHTGRLLKRGGVVGTAVGVSADREAVVRIYLANEKVPELPDRLDDVPVERVVTGFFTAGADPTTRERPAPVGFSVGHPDITAGTIGARVVDSDGTVYTLSNNHVLANSNDAAIGDPSLQPGPADGGENPADSMASLADFQVIDFSSDDNVMDAAIALSTGDNLDNSTPTDDGYGTPGSDVFETIEDRGSLLDLEVQKYGRTTELTQGVVEEVNVTLTVCYAGFGPFCSQSATFVDQIAIGDGSFSDGGDSGSLIVTDDSNANPVGLLFAGSSTRTIGNPIDLVLDRFGVSVDGGEGDGNGEDPDPTGPTAAFTSDCADLTCDFDGSGSEPGDAPIASYDWEFGDGSTGQGETVTHTYTEDGTYTVTLTVTDEDDLQDSDSQEVTVSEDAGEPDISLETVYYKERGLHKADLSWTGATSDDVDVYRDGALVDTVENTGEYTDHIDNRGGATYTHRVCEAGTDVCSNETSGSP